MTSTTQRNSIINRALRICGVVPSGQNATAQQISEAAEALKSVITELKTEGFNRLQIVTTAYDLTASSVVTNGGTIYTCIQPHTSMASTEPGVGALSSSYWDASGVGGAAWALATPYVAVGYKTLNATTEDVICANIRDENGNDFGNLEQIHEQEYSELNEKGATGLPTKFLLRYSSPRQMLMWRQPDNAAHSLVLTEVVNVTLPSGSTSTLDIEDYWDAVVVYKLAYELADEYGLPLQERGWLRNKLEAKLEKAKAKEYRPESDNFIQGAY